MDAMFCSLCTVMNSPQNLLRNGPYAQVRQSEELGTGRLHCHGVQRCSRGGVYMHMMLLRP